MSDTRAELYDPDDPWTWSATMRREHSLAIAASHGHPYECGMHCLICRCDEADEARREAEGGVKE